MSIHTAYDMKLFAASNSYSGRESAVACNCENVLNSERKNAAHDSSWWISQRSRAKDVWFTGRRFACFACKIRKHPVHSVFSVVSHSQPAIRLAHLSNGRPSRRWTKIYSSSHPFVLYHFGLLYVPHCALFATSLHLLRWTSTKITILHQLPARFARWSWRSCRVEEAKETQQIHRDIYGCVLVWPMNELFKNSK